MLFEHIRRFTTTLSTSNDPSDLELYQRLIQSEMQRGMVDVVWGEMRGRG